MSLPGALTVGGTKALGRQVGALVFLAVSEAERRGPFISSQWTVRKPS